MSDIDGVSLLSKFLFNIYPVDALEFEANITKQNIENINKIFPNISELERQRMIQFLKVRMMVSFCHMAENLGAFCLAFQLTYGDWKSEIAGLYNVISDYEVFEVRDFYSEIKNKNIYDIAKIYGHPPIMIQDSEAQHILKLSCKNVKDRMMRIGGLYLDFLQMYNSYKHGYRLLIGKDDKGEDNIVFISKKGQEGNVIIDGSTIGKAHQLVIICRKLVDGMLENHRTRMEYEGADYNVFGKSNRVQSDAERGRLIKQELILAPEERKYLKPGAGFLFSPRGEQSSIEKATGDEVYESLKHHFKEDELGKLVALNVDTKSIIAIDNNIEKLMQSIRTSAPRARLYIRKIGADPKTGLPIY